MSSIPPKPSRRPCSAAPRKPSRSEILSHGESRGGRRRAAAEASTTMARAADRAGVRASGSTPRSAARSKRPSARQKTARARAISSQFSTPSALSTMAIRGRSPGPSAAAMPARQRSMLSLPLTLARTIPSTSRSGTAARSAAICGLDAACTRTQMRAASASSGSAWAIVCRASSIRPWATESSRSKMQISAPACTALRSRAASVPGVKSALRRRPPGSGIADHAGMLSRIGAQAAWLDGCLLRSSQYVPSERTAATNWSKLTGLVM